MIFFLNKEKTWIVVDYHNSIIVSISNVYKFVFLCLLFKLLYNLLDKTNMSYKN